MENELKFVVSDYDALEALLTPLGYVDIEQGYLNPNNRLRRITTSDGKLQYFFTYKQRLPNGHNLDFEPAIGVAEFNELWPHTIERLIKRRVTIMVRDHRWDVDFYRWSVPYFVLAEVEMPPHLERPDAILSYLSDHIIYTVPRADERFTARRLADEDHVRTVARALNLL